MENVSGVTRSNLEELHCWDIQGYQNERESAVTRSIIDELDFLDLQRH